MAGASEPSDLESSTAETSKRVVAALYDRVAASYDAAGPAVFARFGVQVVGGFRERWRVICLLATKPATDTC